MIASGIKQYWIKSISNQLFLDNYNYLDKILQRIANDSAEAWDYHPSQRPIFIYNGKEYWNDTFVFNDSWFPRLNLHPSLKDRMDNYLLEKSSLDRDKAKILAYLKRILNLAQDKEEIFHLSSEELKKLLLREKITTLPTEKTIQFRKDNLEAEKVLANRIMKNLLLKDK